MVFSKQVQKSINGSADVLPDMLPDLPVSLVLLSLIMVDIIEKLRIYPLRGSQKSKCSFKCEYFLKFDMFFTFLPLCYLTTCSMIPFLRANITNRRLQMKISKHNYF